MSHSQFHKYKLFILTHAWLSLWDKHMTTGRINQIHLSSLSICWWNQQIVSEINFSFIVFLSTNILIQKVTRLLYRLFLELILFSLLNIIDWFRYERDQSISSNNIFSHKYASLIKALLSMFFIIALWFLPIIIKRTPQLSCSSLLDFKTKYYFHFWCQTSPANNCN